MADLTVTAAQVSPIFPRFAEIYPVVLAETVTAGQVLYQTSAGTMSVPIGRVVPMSDNAKTKAVYFDVSQTAQHA
jgi:hypothetical protein